MRKKVVFPFLLSAFMLLFLAVPVAAAPAPEPFIVGKVRVTALQDMPGEMKISLFKGAGEGIMKTLAPSGSVPAGVTVFLLQSGGRNLLVDTGYGADTPERKSALPALLQTIGLPPESIDVVLLTHMHGDHIGGLLRNGAAAFPKAEVLVGRVELAYWTAEATLREREKNAQMARDVVTAYGDRLKTFDFGETVARDVVAIAGTGHTPGHTLFMLSSEGAKVLFLGDLVHGAALQFPLPEICATYDMNMEEAAEMRRGIFAFAAGENIPVAGAHLPFPAIGRVIKNQEGEGFTFQTGM